MDLKSLDCVDCGTENCPCYLAETNDCLICSRLQGYEYCDCNWKGVCVYNEFMQGGKKISNIRKPFETTLVERKKYGNELDVFCLHVGKGFALKCSRPGSYIFIRKKDEETYYDTPISVMKTDVDNGNIYVAIKKISSKSKKIFNEGEDYVIRGVYRNGILGVQDVMGNRGSIDRNQKTLIITKGISFAPAVLLAEWIGEKAKTDLIVDIDKISREFVADFIPEKLNGTVVYMDLTEVAGEQENELLSIYTKGEYNKVVVLASDYFIEVISKLMPINARSNNFHLCCGEGICGSCTVVDENGTIFKMCKCR